MNELIDNNLESNALDDNIITTTDTNNSLENDNIEQSIEKIDTLDTSIADNSNSEIVNSLALTIKKDYSLTIAKNIFIKTLRSTWKIVLSVFTLNFLKFFL